MLSLIVARARNGVIGRANALPWQLPEDLAHFRRTTMGHPVVMGRKTWDSIGRPLPGRRNIVVTRDPTWAADGAQTAASLDAAIELCNAADEIATTPSDPTVKTIFVIGGAQLYRDALPRADAMDITEIDRDIDGDTYFPTFDPTDWVETSREAHVGARADALPFAFVRYARRLRSG